MSESNKSYRIRTTVGADNYVNVNLDQDYENFEILSLNIETENAYKMHTSNYGCIVGRVLANGAYGVPNAKISVFIPTEESNEIDPVLSALYPYESVLDKNSDSIRYNTLPDEKVNSCHQVVGTFPNKRLVLDDNNVLEIYDKYYKYSAVSNEAGDYMIFGVPTGEHTVHVDIDLSDIGDLSQTPIDMMYKGYDKNQFESSSMFKKDTELDTLTQIISENTSVFVNPFWGDNSSSNISITRNDIDVKYKFEPTCVFIGSIITDGDNNGISQNCIPSRNMGNMDQLKGCAGTIEMIRKTPEDTVESFVIQGTKLIDGNGTWCYQIPMNLDYMGTDEYGNTVPTNDPNKGVPTRTRVRFRISLADSSTEYVNRHLAKVLVPNNPSNKEDLDYAFGTYSKDDESGSKSFRDLFTNNVYTVKSYIPRIQNISTQRNERFSGIKNITVNNGNSQIPYNNMRVNISFMFILQCAILKIIIRIIRIVNMWRSFWGRSCIVMGDGVCPDLEGWYFAPGCYNTNSQKNTLKDIESDVDENGDKEELSKNQISDQQSIDDQNRDNEEDNDNRQCITSNLDYLMQCVEINLAMEYNVIKFDFYNDWLNGVIYLPQWYGNIKRKRTYFFGLIKRPESVQACMEDTFFNTRRLVQQCSLSYSKDGATGLYTHVTTALGCRKWGQKCHRSYGRNYRKILGKKYGGLVHNETTLKQEHVYYFRPCEWLDVDKRYATKCNLFATDIVMLGSLNVYNKDGIPSAFSDIESTSFKLPGNLVQTNVETDTPLYAMSDGTLCVTTAKDNKNKENFDNSGVTVTTDYNKYIEGNEETDTGDTDEYKLSELSGIDWGFSGPGQGKNNINNLYFPGGHFLGISCFNPETNIKSCVNLSRACEIGVNLSQYQKLVSEVTESGEFNYIRRIPNGLISKFEINDSNFRNIFATLNFNGLRTAIDPETHYRYYDIISNLSFNFDGSLSDKINGTDSEYNKTEKAIKFGETGSGTSEVTLYRSVIEETSYDYYYYRFGLNNNTDEQLILSKYLIKQNGMASIPMYNNSFYFYFGIRAGQTAYDRFLNDFYSVCPTESSLLVPIIEIIDINNVDFCNNGKGTATVKLDELGSAYTIELYQKDKETGVYKQLHLTFVPDNGQIYIAVAYNESGNTLSSQYKEFTIGSISRSKALTDGEYHLNIVTMIDQAEYVKEFTIETTEPKEVTEIKESIKIHDFNKPWEDTERNDINSTIENGGFIEINIPKNYYGSISGLTLINNDTIICACSKVNGSYDAGGEGNGGYCEINENNTGTTINMYVPYGEVSYTLNYSLDCNKDLMYVDDTPYYVVMPSSIGFYFGSMDANNLAIKRALKTTDNGVFKDDNWYKNDELMSLDPKILWYIEKSLIYDSSMYDVSNYGHRIPLDVKGVDPVITYSGHGELVYIDNYYLKDYIGKDESVNPYTVDYMNFNFPTQMYHDGECIDMNYLQKLKDLGIIKYADATKLYNYNIKIEESNNG